MKEALTFNDVLLVPQYSTLKSRSEANPETTLGELTLKVPFLSANMSTISGLRMAQAMGRFGGAAILHRYTSFDTIYSWVMSLVNEGLPAIPSIGVSDIDREYAEDLSVITPHICVDIAHADSVMAEEMVSYCKGLGFKTIIAGNVCTYGGALRLIQAGANVVKCGTGSGSICSTRTVSGHGFPQLSAIMETSRVREVYPDVAIIADGGLSSSGDIVKALAAGASAIMSGSLFAGYDEAENPAVYAGMASAVIQMSHHGKVNNNAPEGVAFGVDPKGPVLSQLELLLGGVRSGMSYSGARTLAELQENAEFVRVTSNTVIENGTRAP